jgi:CRISPR/Cas system CSM-associated protein Csm3 (group 7 of RAMP superfamily)
MFGNAGNARGCLAFSDMKAEGADIHVDMRTGNAIDRCRRVASDNSLFSIETASGTTVLAGEIAGMLPKLKDETAGQTARDLLEAAIKAIPYIGGNTGRGLGWVRENGISVEWLETDVTPPAEVPGSARPVTVAVTIKPLSPLLIGGKTPQSNFRATLKHIPGGVVKAALAANMLAKDGDENRGGSGKDERRNWVSGEGGNGRFPTMRPAFPDIKISQFLPSGCRFAPITAEKPKYTEKGQPQHTRDKLLDLLCTAGHAGGKAAGAKTEETMERVKGFIYEKDGTCAKDPLTMVVTRSALNRFSGTVRDAMLFSMEALVPGDGSPGGNALAFEGTISGEFDPDELKKLVEGGIRVGGYGTAGYGQCSVEIKEAKDKEEAQEAERAELDQRLSLFVERYKRVPVTLRSDAVVDLGIPKGASNEDFIAAYSDALFGALSEEGKVGLPDGLQLIRVIAAHEQWRGFDTSKKTGYLKEVTRLIKAGAVFVFEVAELTDDIKKRFYRLQENGICKGLDALNGLGQVVVADMYHLNEMDETEGET